MSAHQVGSDFCLPEQPPPPTCTPHMVCYHRTGWISTQGVHICILPFVLVHLAIVLFCFCFFFSGRDTRYMSSKEIKSCQSITHTLTKAIRLKHLWLLLLVKSKKKCKTVTVKGKYECDLLQAWTIWYAPTMGERGVWENKSISHHHSWVKLTWLSKKSLPKHFEGN